MKLLQANYNFFIVRSSMRTQNCIEGNIFFKRMIPNWKLIRIMLQNSENYVLEVDQRISRSVLYKNISYFIPDIIENRGLNFKAQM